MALVTIQDLIAKAIDNQDVKLAAQVADLLRSHGCNYAEVLARVQAARPNVTADEWESLMYEADSGEEV